MGDKISSSPYKLEMNNDVFCSILCEQDLSAVRVPRFLVTVGTSI